MYALEKDLAQIMEDNTDDIMKQYGDNSFEYLFWKEQKDMLSLKAQMPIILPFSIQLIPVDKHIRHQSYIGSKDHEHLMYEQTIPKSYKYLRNSCIPVCMYREAGKMAVLPDCCYQSYVWYPL